MRTVLPTAASRVFGVAMLGLSLVASACATTKAQVALEPPPPLAVPSAPPRIIVPPDPTQPLPEEEPAPTAVPIRPRAPRTQPRAAEPPKPEPAKPPDATEPPKPANGGTEPAPASTLELRPSNGAGESNIRQQLGRASQELGKVNYASLSNDMKAQFDTARRFITLAEQAITEQNLLFAATLADKAGAIAVLLQRR